MSDDGPRRANFDAELFADAVDRPVAPQLVPDDAAIVKSQIILRALVAAGLKTEFHFDLDEAKILWAGRLARFKLDVLEEAITDWISAPGRDFPTVGDVESAAISVNSKRAADAEYAKHAHNKPTCVDCDGIRWVKVFDVDPESGATLQTWHLRPCPSCPEMRERSDLYDAEHFTPVHQDHGGCPQCWKYMPSQAAKLRVVERAVRAKR